MYRLPKFFCPNLKTKLIRLGRPNDGGYCVPEKSLDEVKILFSFGLDDDWSFEKDFEKKTKTQVLCFDSSVNYKFWIKRFLKGIIYFDFRKNYYEQFKRIFTYINYKYFFRRQNVLHIKKHITSNDISLPLEIKKNFTNFKNIFNTWGNNSFFLKMDIEGNEYRVLDNIIENQKNMLGLVVEFHECDLMQHKIKSFIEKLHLDLVHLHVNNFCTIAKDNFPTVLELTFSAKKYNFKRNEDEFDFPKEEIDQPNNKEATDEKIFFY